MAKRWIIVTVALVLILGLGGCATGEKVSDNDAKSIQKESGDDRGEGKWPPPTLLELGEEERPPVDEDWQPPKEWGEKWPEDDEKWQRPKEWGEETSPKDSTK